LTLARGDGPLGLILAGGQARRMGGVDKALMPFAGARLIDQILDRFAPQVAGLALSANGDPARFSSLRLPVLADADPSRGPLSGVLAGLLWAARAGASHLVTVPVDAPFLPQDLVPRLLWAAEPAPDAPVLARTAQGLHPTFALWPTASAKALAAFLASGASPRLRDFAAAQGAGFADFPSEAEFANLNTPEDLARAARDAL
jgi:molybdopterin-guanine dinucleotide biosynthesis protein A